MKKFLFGVMCAAIFSTASAIEIRPFSLIDNIGSDSETESYFKLAAGMPGECNYNLMYFNNSTPTGKAMLAMLLQSQATGVPVSSVRYEMEGEICRVNMIGIGNSSSGY